MIDTTQIYGVFLNQLNLNASWKIVNEGKREKIAAIDLKQIKIVVAKYLLMAENKFCCFILDVI